MSLLKTIFGNKTAVKAEKEASVNWISLTSLNQLTLIKEQSKKMPILIFKHSTRCGISRMVLKQFENDFDTKLINLKLYYLDLLNYRNISDQIAIEFNVLHQSPQLLIIKDTIAVANASHSEITKINLHNI